MEYDVGKRTLGKDQKAYLSLEQNGEYKGQVILNSYDSDLSVLKTEKVVLQIKGKE